MFFLFYLTLLLSLVSVKQNTVERASLRFILGVLFFVIVFFKVRGYPDYAVMSNLQGAPFQFGRNTAMQIALKLTKFLPFELFYVAVIFVGHLLVLKRVVKSNQETWYFAFFLPIIFSGFLKQGLAIIVMLVVSRRLTSLIALIHPATMLSITVLRRKLNFKLILFSLMLLICMLIFFGANYVQTVYVNRAYSSAMFLPITILLIITNKVERNIGVLSFVMFVLVISQISSALAYRLLVIVFYFLFSESVAKRNGTMADLTVLAGFVGWWCLSPDSNFFL